MRHEIETDEWDEATPLQRGQADSDYDGTEWVASDVVLYVPDLSARMGYAKYWVNRRGKPAGTTRRIGFRGSTGVRS